MFPNFETARTSDSPVTLVFDMWWHGDLIPAWWSSASILTEGVSWKRWLWRSQSCGIWNAAGNGICQEEAEGLMVQWFMVFFFAVSKLRRFSWWWWWWWWWWWRSKHFDSTIQLIQPNRQLPLWCFFFKVLVWDSWFIMHPYMMTLISDSFLRNSFLSLAWYLRSCATWRMKLEICGAHEKQK